MVYNLQPLRDQYTKLTGPKMKFPTYFAFQYMTFPNISYTFLVEDSTKFHGNVWNM